MTYDDLLQQMSGVFLTERFPKHAAEMTGYEIEEHILNHKWYPFEMWDAEDIYDLIVSATDDINLIVKL